MVEKDDSYLAVATVLVGMSTGMLVAFRGQAQLHHPQTPHYRGVF